MTSIKKIGVLGSGVMGSGIAAQVANSGTPVVLLDIVKPGEKNRNALTEGAIEKQLKANPTGFTHKDKAKLVTCGNLEDDLKLLADCDWIIEVVLEKLEVKQDVYRKIDSVRKPSAVVSSNTSTLPLHELMNGMPEAFQQQFMITHFFNPPRFMRLLEVVKGTKTSQAAYDAVCQFADIHLGKGVVACKDTPGFIGNRIGVYWLMLGLIEAMRLDVSPEQADAVMGRPVGIPKTGVFGLFDLIGIDLMPLIAKSMLHSLPKDDPFVKIYHEPELVKKMIEGGYTGRKGKGGFYRINKDGEKKIKEVISLKTGDYSPQSKKVELASVDAAKSGMLALLSHKDIGGQYARAVLLPMLHYAASLIPEISDDVASVDAAMKTGYSWKYGPFEMIDKIGVDHFISLLEQSGMSVPAIIAQAKGGSLYKQDGTGRQAASVKGYVPITQPAGTLMLADVKLTKKPVLKNASASLWDLGDGIACLELTSKMNSIDPDILDMMMKSIEAVKKDFGGLVIGGDADNFSVGANLGFVLMAANIAAWKQIGEVIRAGQQSVMALKYAPFPVVSSLSGMALGGGCEIILHSNAVQAHIESYPGLVEVGVGLIPAWGGCKEMLIRHMGDKKSSGGMLSNLMATGGAMPAIKTVFEQIALAKVSGSADEARDAKIIRESDGITMNRARVLADAKAKCLSMANGYTAPEPAILHLPGGTAKVALSMAVDGFKAMGKATAHDVTVCKMLATVLSGGDTDMSEGLTEQNILDLEFEVFMELLKMKPTLDRIEHMLNTGKPLRN
ncbi:MAG: 3-hydroxyacyl-CoA dehydrogenase NAD-binding domain-containing protein [Alphaproteobacteria bacterium]|nr:3-hydroxyacyl-CoA dehydrogenase NAD-binding domain-containing protein [Alphaproteobacteria bacterium]